MPATVDELIKHPRRFFIGGDWTAPSGDTTFKLVTPSSEEIFAEVAEAQPEDIYRAIKAARDAFDNGPWARMSHKERAHYLIKFAEKIEQYSPKLSAIWTSEIGVPSAFADIATPAASYAFRYYASLADSFPFVERHEALHSPGSAMGLLVHEPVGVVAAIVPWNGPLSLISWKTAPALLAGCTVIIKNSPETPGAGLVIAEIAEEIGLPRGVLNVVTAGRQVSELLVRSRDVDKVTFTGSSGAGKRIASLCGERIARCTLELGGKSAGVILDDMPLEAAAESISQTARILSGQVCSSLTRVIVSEHRHDEFVDALASKFNAINVGDPFDSKTQMGPLAMGRQRDRVESYIEKGKAEGAKLAAGGQRPSHLNRGYYIQPTVFANVDNSMAIAQEEIFGPVVSVVPVKNESEAVRVANDTVFGLNATVFTLDPNRAYDVARQLRSGTVGHQVWRTDFSIAFGGFKESGIGREGGVEGLRPFLESKTIVLNGVPDQFK
jgi:aldehyde dehydrogenase (NAD+)